MQLRQQGFSILELMVAITIGLMLLAGLASVFSNSSTANRELKRTSEQIENGRFAIELLTQDLRHAGYYGEYWKLPAVPATADPCTLPTDGTVNDTTNNFVSVPVQLYPASTFAAAPTPPTACASLLTSANLAPGSDIIVVRRAQTTALTGSPVSTTYYMQTTPSAAYIAKGAAGTLTRRDVTGTAVGTPPVYPQVAAYLRRYLTRIYFVAPCSVPNGGGSICTGANDDQGRPIPTLKRLELDTDGTFKITPLVEGIQLIRAEFGADTAPATVDAGTGLIGDGVPDVFNRPASTDIAQMSNAIAVRIYVLARNTEPSTGYKDEKTYTLGTATTTAANDEYKRHVYGAEARIANVQGRREIPN